MHTVTTDPRSMAQESGLPTGLRSRGLPLWPALTGVCVVLIAAAVLAAGPSDIMCLLNLLVLRMGLAHAGGKGGDRWDSLRGR